MYHELCYRCVLQYYTSWTSPALLFASHLVAKAIAGHLVLTFKAPD